MLSAARLLSAWEQVPAPDGFVRAFALLRLAMPEASDEELGRLTSGQRDAALFSLRKRAFGQRLELLMSCPSCGERLELAIQVSELESAVAAPESSELCVDAHGYTVRCRLPTQDDLGTVAADGPSFSSRARLLERCLLSAEHSGERVPIDTLPENVVRAIDEAMRVADPAAHFEIGVSCAACSHDWLAPFDIAALLWSEVDAWAERVLHEVHCLARAYGWREADILALSAKRRFHYLKLAASA
jgi:hypothetical protein